MFYKRRTDSNQKVFSLQDESNRCSLCDSTNIKKIFTKQIDKKDHTYTSYSLNKFADMIFTHFQCLQCGFIFLPRPSDLNLGEYYGNEYYNTNYAHQEKIQIPEFQEAIEQISTYAHGKKILDVGCALGFSLKVYTQNGYESYGMESSDFAVTHAQKQTRFKVVQESIEGKTSWDADFFDVVTMNDVVEHLAQPIRAFEEVSRILKKGGILHIRTLNWNGLGRRIDKLDWVLLNPPGHMSYFTPETLSYALQKSGFSIIKINCPKILSKKWFFQKINYVIFRKIPKLDEMFASLKLGDVMNVIAVKT